jgi:hypothetical protein
LLGHTTNYAVFGLGMLWIAYLVWLYLVLEFNSITFVPLNFIGSKFKRFGEANSSLQDYKKVNPASSDKQAGGYEMVQLDDQEDDGRLKIET